MVNRDLALPDYQNPPIDETVLSIQFAPIPDFSVPHFGLYWKQIRREFGRYEVKPPIATATEQFDTTVRPSSKQFGIQLVEAPDVRCWFLDDSGTRLIQIQSDRLVHNWRRVTGSEVYPRYPAVRDTLRKEWERFCSFLQTEGFVAPDVNQCEVTYVNHIEYGTGWSGYSELSDVIAGWSGRGSGKFLPAAERATMKVHYLLPNKKGRLHISVDPVVRVRDGQEVLQLSLTARGAPESSQLESILGWLDLGREWVVKGFTDFTTQKMHKIWGRKL